MSRKAETFFDAITRLREDLIEEAQNHKFRKRTAAWKKFGSLAACLVLIMSIGALALLPRGCGSSGAGSNNSAAPADNNSGGGAPQESPASCDTAPPLYGVVDPDTPEGSSENGSPSGAIETSQFTAIVIEVQDEAILVEPIEYDSHYQWLVPAIGLECPALAEGDWVTVTYDVNTPALTTNPPVLQGVQSIEKIDPE